MKGSKGMRKIGVKEIEDIAAGAAVYGTGGGGDPYVGKLMAIDAIKTHGEVTMLDVDEVPDDAIVVPTNMMGAPTILIEKIPNGKEAINAFSLLKDYLGKEIFATIPFEAGGLNSMIPFAVAATLGMPIVDGDGMGRAFPEIQMVTFSLGGVKSTPLVVCDEKGNATMFNTVSNKWSETLARAVTVASGGSTMMASYTMTGSQVKKTSIRGIVTKTEEVGRAIRIAKNKNTNPVDAVLKVSGGFELFKGKVCDILRKTDGGFVRGESKMTGIDEYKGKSIKIEFQNENLIVQTNEGEILATAPDLIVVLDIETGHAITTETLRYGNRGIVICIPCDEKWRTKDGIKTVGPRYFGYDVDYVPIEQRIKSRMGEF
jgi:DUF917 family protein